MHDAATLELNDCRVTLLPQRAACIDDSKLLLIADLHLGKAVSFRRQGVPVPAGTSSDNLDRLSALVRARGIGAIVFLGDFLHAAHARRSESTMQALRRWRDAHVDLDLTLVRGNHDAHAGDPPAWLGARCVDEPWTLRPGIFACHHPRPRDGGFVIAGHQHPSVVVAAGFERMRLPCFHRRDGVLVLPAFGAFTGMAPIEREAADEVHAVMHDRVWRVP
jgi:uncharacterized protein